MLDPTFFLVLTLATVIRAQVDLCSSGLPVADGVCRGGGEIPGIAGVDYPIYSEVPRTNFRCSNVGIPGYFADPESRCQAFYICERQGKGTGILCPNGTLFNQEVLVCDWWQHVDCSRAVSLYPVNQKVLAEMNAANERLGVNQRERERQAGVNLLNNNANSPFNPFSTQNLLNPYSSALTTPSPFGTNQRFPGANAGLGSSNALASQAQSNALNAQNQNNFGQSQTNGPFGPTTASPFSNQGGRPGQSNSPFGGQGQTSSPFGNDQGQTSSPFAGQSGQNGSPFSNQQGQQAAAFNGQLGQTAAFAGQQGLTPSPFGGQQGQTSSPFGGQQGSTASPFGGQQGSTASPFGGQQGQNSSPFGGQQGQTSSPFGGQQGQTSSPFGNQPGQPSTPFGAPLGSRPGQSPFGGQPGSTPSFGNQQSPTSSPFNDGQTPSPFGDPYGGSTPRPPGILGSNNQFDENLNDQFQGAIQQQQQSGIKGPNRGQGNQNNRFPNRNGGPNNNAYNQGPTTTNPNNPYSPQGQFPNRDQFGNPSSTPGPYGPSTASSFGNQGTSGENFDDGSQYNGGSSTPGVDGEFPVNPYPNDQFGPNSPGSPASGRPSNDRNKDRPGSGYNYDNPNGGYQYNRPDREYLPPI